jgi:methionyl-tRNA formyltransferase
MKLLLLADQQIGLEVFNYLRREFPEDIAVVVTTAENEIYTIAKSEGFEVEIFNSKQYALNLADFKIDLGVLAWWPYILREPLISFPKEGFINFHPSLLPHNRGKHYNFWALVEEAPFGVTLHRVDNGIDTGEIISQRSISYDWEDTGETLYRKAQKEIVTLFCETYPDLRHGKITATAQDLSKGSFHLASELDAASKIDLNTKYSARELLNVLRARTFEGYPGSWFEDQDGQKYEIRIQIKRKA